MNWLARAHGGYVIPHHPEMKSLITGHAKGFELCAEFTTDGSKEWHSAYKNPSLGLDFFMTSLGNPEQLGEQYSLLLGPILPLNPGKKISARLQIGMGPGIATKTWDLETNYQATPIGSTLNGALLAQLELLIPISNRARLSVGARMSHLSNAAFKLPNLGTNLTSVFLGLHLGKIKTVTPPSLDEKPEPSFKPKMFSAGLSTGFREILPPGGRKYQTWTLSVGRDWRRTYKSAFGVYADVFYNPALTPLLEQAGEKDLTHMANVRLGISGAYTIHFQNWHLLFVVGGYLKNDFKRDGWIYNKVSLRYHFPKSWYASFGMKTHLSVADHWEWGIGYVFPEK